MEEKNSLKLAEERTTLAGIRTLLAFIRTGLVSISLAFAFMKFDKTNPIDAFTIFLFIFAGACIIAGIITMWLTRKNLFKITSK